MYTHIINGMILICSLCLLINKRKRVETSHMVAYIIFSLIPATGLFAQILLSGVAYIPSSVTVSIVILFVFVQNSRVRNDHLTGIFNRRQLDFYLEDKIEQAKQGKVFTAILLDLDDFKIINDTYGHLVGDEVIKLTAKLLDSCIGKNEFLARYGGDEFLIITTKYEPA
jgi:GGDEF domain-containing protein